MNAVLRDTADTVSERPWEVLLADLDLQGWAVLPALLSPAVCVEITQLYDDDRHFRSRVIMARHGFGRGEYRYFDYPLLPVLQQLRSSIYPYLSTLANDWNARLQLDVRFPSQHSQFLARCHQDGQTLATPLLLKYEVGDYNCLHQDIYGAHVFPLQVAVLLSEPGRDFTGGEFVLTEQRPRMQTRATVAPLRQGDALMFAVRQRPVRGSRGDYRVNQRHGVSRLLTGRRFTLGVIFHDAKQ
jgi:uncharacterized protein